MLILYDLVDSNMTDWRSVAATVVDTTTVLNSCSLKCRRRASPSVREEKGAQNESPYVCE
jgi:hypothetical protein